MGENDILSLPALEDGNSVQTGGTAWVYTGWQVVGTPSATVPTYLIGFAYQTPPLGALDADHEQIVEIGLGATGSEVTTLQLPTVVRKDTLVAHLFSGPEAVFILPEPVEIPAGTQVSWRIASSTITTTIGSFKIFYREGVVINLVGTPTLVAPADAGSIVINEPNIFDWNFNDPNVGDTQSAWALRRRVADDALLTWAPPSVTEADWNPEIITITDGSDPGDICRASTQDVLIDIQGRMLNRLWIEGCRHVEVIGGEIENTINNGGGSGYGNTGIIIRRREGITHIEGVWLHGAWVSDAIALNCASDLSIVQVQNCRFEDMRVTVAEHADLIHATHGVARNIWMDKVTYRTNYKGDELQNLLLGSTASICGQGNWGDATYVTLLYHKKRVNGYAKKGNLDNAGGEIAGSCHAFCRQTPGFNGYSGAMTPMQLDDVWIDNDPTDPHDSWNFGTSAFPGIGNSGEYAPSYTDGTQTALVWPVIAEIDGILRKGVPPEGDFVPAGVAGANYVSPGYL